MKKHIFMASLVLAFLLALPVFAQEDLSLNDEIEEADRVFSEDLAEFRSIITESYGLTEAQAESLLTKTKLSPGDFITALELAAASGEDPEKIASRFEENPGLGWGAISLSLGIKPGSDEFKSIQTGIRKRAEYRVREENTVKAREEKKTQDRDKQKEKPDKGKKS